MRRPLWAAYLVAWPIWTANYILGAVRVIRTHEASWVVSGAADITFTMAGLLALAYMLSLARWRVWRGYAFSEDPGLFVPAYLEGFALVIGIRLPEALRGLRRRNPR